MNDNSRLPTVAGQRDLRHVRTYYGKDWPRIRKSFLAKHPFCQGTSRDGLPCTEVACHVDHIVPYVQGERHMWDNLQSLCHSCHSRKTVAQDGGFGRRKVYETR